MTTVTIRTPAVSNQYQLRQLCHVQVVRACRDFEFNQRQCNLYLLSTDMKGRKITSKQRVQTFQNCSMFVYSEAFKTTSNLKKNPLCSKFFFNLISIPVVCIHVCFQIYSIIELSLVSKCRQIYICPDILHKKFIKIVNNKTTESHVITCSYLDDFGRNMSAI